MVPPVWLKPPFTVSTPVQPVKVPVVKFKGPALMLKLPPTFTVVVTLIAEGCWIKEPAACDPLKLKSPAILTIVAPPVANTILDVAP